MILLKPLTISNPHWEYYYLKDYRYRDYDRTVCSVCTLALSKENKNAHYFNFYITKDKKYAVLHCAEYNTTLKDFVDCENTDPFHYEPIPPDTAIEELYYIVFPQ